MLALMENATEVRKNWSEFVDNVAIGQKPKVVSRNNKHPFLSISLEQVATLLHAYQFNVTIEHEEDGTYSVDLNNFDLFANADTLEEAYKNLANDLVEYAQEYIEDIQTYYAAPNRTNHLPYVMVVLMQNDLDSVVNLFNAHV